MPKICTVYVLCFWKVENDVSLRLNRDKLISGCKHWFMAINLDRPVGVIHINNEYVWRWGLIFYSLGSMAVLEIEKVVKQIEPY